MAYGIVLDMETAKTPDTNQMALAPGWTYPNCVPTLLKMGVSLWVLRHGVQLSGTAAHPYFHKLVRLVVSTHLIKYLL